MSEIIINILQSVQIGHDHGYGLILIFRFFLKPVEDIHKTNTVIQSGQRIVPVHFIHLFKKHALVLYIDKTADADTDGIGNSHCIGVV